MAITDNTGQKSKLVTGVTIKVNLEVYYFIVRSSYMYNSICMLTMITKNNKEDIAVQLHM